jgi:hypothetical protein
MIDTLVPALVGAALLLGSLVYAVALGMEWGDLEQPPQSPGNPLIALALTLFAAAAGGWFLFLAGAGS